MRVDKQYVALVSHVRAKTTKGDSPLEDMSILGRCQNRSKSNAVARSWTLLATFQAAHGLLVIGSRQVTIVQADR